MGQGSFFLYTNILIYFFEGQSEVVDLIKESSISLSIISEIELLSFKKLNISEVGIIREFLSFTDVVALTEPIKDVAIEIRKSYRLSLPDSIIAASSFYLNKKLITADKSFEKLDFMNVPIYEP